MISLRLLLRCLIGGTLMGLANLVPGISGGTMLLAAGVYPLFVNGVADVTTLRLRWRSLVPLAAIGGAAALSIVLLAGPVKGLVVEHRWIMYSLFIGLTLGGVPVVWRLLRPLTPAAAIGCAGGLGLMALMALAQPAEAGGGGGAWVMLFIAGAAGASAMILPGVSGGYLLLILGQYIPILGAIESAKTAVQSFDWDLMLEAMRVLLPVAAGLAVGVAGVSNLIKLLLERRRKPTLGVLLGLLLGAVIGLWPFQQGVPPQPGEVVKGRVMTPASIADLDPEDYPVRRFDPSAGQIAASLGLILAGLGVTLAVARLGEGAEV